MILFVFGTNSFYLKSKVTPLNILYTQNKHKWLKNTHVSLKKNKHTNIDTCEIFQQKQHTIMFS